MVKQLYQEIASLMQARRNCETSNNTEWAMKHGQRIVTLVDDYLPSGSGFDAGTKLLIPQSTPERLVFQTSYHHMDDVGGYDGWTEHEVVVTPSLVFGFNLRVTGSNRNDIKDYIAEVFQAALTVQLDAVTA
jgi:hypothetical protein